MGLTFKKTLRAAEQVTLNAARLVFIEETFVTTAMTRLYGRGPCGERVIGTGPQGHWRTTTFVAALRSEGLTAPMVTEGPMTGELFLAYVREFLCPTLAPGDLVIWDNLSSRHVSGVLEAIEACGARVGSLPPYSRDFDPIEQLFAQFKARLRKAGQRTLEAIENTIGTLVNQFAPAECVTKLLPQRRLCRISKVKTL